MGPTASCPLRLGHLPRSYHPDPYPIPPFKSISTSSNPQKMFPATFPAADPRWKPAVEHAPNCPRCASANTKFCYYNNYSLSQPRYFCKACKRYWTKGGSLRNVPVGGGCRKNRRRRSSRTAYSHNPGSLIFGGKDDSLAQLHSTGSDLDVGSGLDLAVVFANFLNPNAIGVGSEQGDGPITISESEFSDDHNALIGISETVYPVGQEPGFMQSDPCFVGEKQLENMNTLHYDEQIQSFLRDELVWSDPGQTRPDQEFPTWQSIMQVQDLDLVESGSDGVDCLKTINMTVDNWTSFDFQCF